MRVLCVGNMYPPHSLGGYEVIWRSAVLAMREHGWEVRVLTTGHREPGVDGPEDPDVHRDLDWYWRDHAFPRMGPAAVARLERRNARVLAGHLDGFGPDVVSWWAMGGMSLSMIEQARRRGLPAIGVVIDDWMVYGPKVDRWRRLCGRLGPLAGLAERATGVPASLHLADAAVWAFVSEYCRGEAMVARGELPRTAIARSGIDAALFSGPPAPERPWGWRLGYVGRIDERKGIGDAVRALAELPDEATLTVTGGGDEEERSRLEALISELGLDGRVSFRTVPRAEVPSVYAEADCILFPVRWNEPWGLVPIEAMSVGRPVIATGTGGSAEYLRDRENCLLTPPGEPSRLAERIRELAGDERLRGRLRGAGLEVAATYTDRDYNDRLIELHRSVAEGEGTGSSAYPSAA